MDTLSFKTKYLRKEDAEKNWVLVDAESQVLGRLASQVAGIIKGKHKPAYTPNVDCGDHVIIINADKVRLTGRKMTQKSYIRYTGYPGGQRFTSPREVLRSHPERLIEMAVRGMLPKNKLGRKMFSSLHIYAGSSHPHEAQQPKELKFNI